VAVGADGLMVEVHDRPEEALSDGDQALLPEEFERLMGAVRLLAPLVERSVPSYAAT
jgi:3-deoxy-7-phosphoheptulonate synthase